VRELLVVGVALIGAAACQNESPAGYEVDAPQIQVSDGDAADELPSSGGDEATVVDVSPSGRSARIAVQIGICGPSSADGWIARVNESDDEVEVEMVPPNRLREDPLVCTGSLLHSFHEVRFRDDIGERTVEASIEPSIP
jgi:hypothetical protein